MYLVWRFGSRIDDGWGLGMLLVYIKGWLEEGGVLEIKRGGLHSGRKRCVLCR